MIGFPGFCLFFAEENGPLPRVFIVNPRIISLPQNLAELAIGVVR